MEAELVKFAAAVKNVSDILGSCQKVSEDIQAMLKPGASSSWSTRQEEVNKLRSEVAKMNPLIRDIIRDFTCCSEDSIQQLEALSRNLDTTSKENVLRVIAFIKDGFHQLIDEHKKLRTEADRMKSGLVDLKDKVDDEKPENPVGTPILKVFGAGAGAVIFVGTVEQLFPKLRIVLRLAAGLITLLTAYCEGKKWLKMEECVREMDRKFSGMNQAIDDLNNAIENSERPLSGANSGAKSLHNFSVSVSLMGDTDGDGGLSTFRQEMRCQLPPAIQNLKNALLALQPQTPQPP
jgi:hypothetical protein